MLDSRHRCPGASSRRRNFKSGFTLIELAVGGSIMLLLVLAALTLYARSNKVSVDQSGYAEIQHSVRSSMYLLTRDVRMAGLSMPQEFVGYYIEGMDNDPTDTAAVVKPDRLVLVGGLEWPVTFRIYRYQGSSITLDLMDYSFEQNPYVDTFYDNKLAIIVPNPSSACRSCEFRWISHVTHNTGATNEKLNFSPGQAPGIDPPGGLSGTCGQSSDYDGGSCFIVNVKEYWLDVTGNYPGLTAGQNGYIGNGNGNILYCHENGTHYPIAQNVENLQFQYNGDLNSDGTLDGFRDWSDAWTHDQIGRIRLIRAWVLGKTKNKFVGVSGTPPGGIRLYRRPAVANSPGATADDLCRRFLMDSTVNVRNMSLNIYYLGER